MSQSKATNEELDTLHSLVAKTLSARIRAGEATPADLSVAVKFLKDNGVQQVAVAGSPIANLLKDLPFAAEGREF